MTDIDDPFENRFLPAVGYNVPKEWNRFVQVFSEWAGNKWINSSRQFYALSQKAEEYGVEDVPYGYSRFGEYLGERREEGVSYEGGFSEEEEEAIESMTYEEQQRIIWRTEAREESDIYARTYG